MASSLSAFASPLGPLHFAPPSSMSTYSITSLFRSPKAPTSSLPSPKRPKKVAKLSQSLQVSSPIMKSSSTTYDHYCEGPSRSSPPPPYPRNELARAEMGTEEDLEYAEATEAEDEQLSRREKLSIEEMERRLEQWEQERIEKKRARTVEQDRRIGNELRMMGL